MHVTVRYRAIFGALISREDFKNLQGGFGANTRRRLMESLLANCMTLREAAATFVAVDDEALGRFVDQATDLPAPGEAVVVVDSSVTDADADLVF